MTLGGRTRPRLEDVTLDIPAGRIALLGVSGAGKSSLLGVLAGFEPVDSGNVTCTGNDSPLQVYWAPQYYG